ncbi:PQQ-binding-like beta-propeller repeat protein [Flavobacterium sp. N1994]|uniref:PQQ-binding-like beta-propeller repeat protein n=1 Tax=Flavobacterium sp. N1994 TaxID=2986827 RepID=UPI0022231C66|nr:PQQ-binding-like beta-propeller repeat protein [Flavobacterium sp. N1994]
MKKLFILFTLFISLFTLAQVPQGISYQAIALNGSGAPVVSSNVRVRLSILDSTTSGTVLYSETHLKTTNAQGLFNLVIGQGTVVSGTFATINWGINSKFLKVEMDATGGTTYVLVGTTQLLSVPYAMTAGSLADASANDSIENNKTSNFAFASTSGNVYAFNATTGAWVGQSGSVSAVGGLISSNKNVAFRSTSGTVYAFNSSTNTWIAQSGTVSSSGGLIGSNGNFAFASTSGTVYAFNKNTGIWYGQSGSVSSTGGLVGSNGSFAFGSTSGTVYAFNPSTNTWIAQSGTVSSSGGLISSNGNFAFGTTSGNVYAYTKSSGVWTVQAGTVSATGGLISSPSN